jgi:hypothetical protein
MFNVCQILFTMTLDTLDIMVYTLDILDTNSGRNTMGGSYGRENTAILERIGWIPPSRCSSYSRIDHRGIRRGARPLQDRVLRKLSFPDLPV